MLSVALIDDILKGFITDIDRDILDQLEQFSTDLFHEKYTALELSRTKYHTWHMPALLVWLCQPFNLC